MEQRLLLTAAPNDPGEFFYSLTSPGKVFNSDHSRLWVDDSDIVKLTINDDGTWEHELHFDGSDVGLHHWEEDIDAFAIRDDGSILISTLGCAHVSGVNHIDGGDLLLFRPTSTGAHTSGSWEMYLDGSDVGLSHRENIDAVSELSDGSLVISTQRNGKLPGIGHVRDEDLSRFDPTSTGDRTRGSWSRYVDGSDISLHSFHENIDGVTIGDDGTTVALSTTGTAWVPGLVAKDEDIFSFQATQLGSHTTGDYDDSLTLNSSRAGISPYYDIDAFHASLGDSTNPQPPVIDDIGDRTIDELTELSLTATATDADTPAADLTWSLVSGPDSASIDAVTGQFSWTPSEADGPGSVEVTLAVSDGDLTDSETFLVTVNEVNTAPVLAPIGNRSANGGANISFDADATDADLPANTLTYSLSGDIPAGSTFDAATGEFAWQTTSANNGQSYDVTVTVSDGSLSDSESFTISVTGSGLQVQSISDQSVNELEPFTYQVEATGGGSTGLPDIDFETAGGQALNAGDVITDQFASLGIHVTTDDPSDHPAMIFDSSNPTGGDRDLGTPNQKFGGPGVGNGGKSGRWKNDVARNNILIISEDGDASDPDDNARGGVLIFTFDAPTDIEAIGLLDVDSGRNTVRFYDAAGSIIGSKNIPRRGNNSAQTLDLNKTGVSRMEVDFAGSGAITDLFFADSGTGGGGPLTYALAAGAPEGMTISDLGLIEWTPTEEQGPGTFEVTVLVSDGSSTVEENFLIDVAEVNVAPVIASIDNQSIDELSPFELQVEATDSDLPANTLTYSLAAGAPAGMAISSSGLIEWTPTEAQGPGVFPVTVQVSDGTATSTEAFDITVGEVNVAPVIEAIADQSIDELSRFALQVEATDSDLPANTLTYSLAAGSPDGMTISDSGLVEWTPSEEQGPDVFPVTVQVSDGTVTSTEAFEITVGEVNVAPVIAAIGDQSIDELSPFALQVEATDSDLPANTLTYSLAAGAPDGMTISSSGLIEWTPTEEQGPGVFPVTVEVSDGTVISTEAFDITVGEVNVAPVLATINNQTIPEQQSFSLQATATDEDLPANSLTFSLTGSVPSGMSITDSGLLSWTPDESQGPGNYSITIEVSDGEATDSQTFSVTVEEANRAPEIAGIDDQQLPELTAFELQVLATDPDLPATELTYAFASPGAPAGMTISDSGLIQWTPGEVDGPATYDLAVEVSDGELTDVETFTLTVTEQNTAPVLAAIDNLTVFPGNQISFDADATDSDLPANELVYSLSGDVPADASFDSATGQFAWAVPANATLGIRNLTVTVSDQQGGFDSQTLTITVEGPAVSSITLVEDDRFETTATQDIIVPAGPAYFEFEILNLEFDTDSNGRMNDAFEVALLDASGDSLVHTFASDRDAFFNVSEGDLQSVSVNAEVSGNVVRVDLSHLPEGTEATIVYRLVNNDNGDADDNQTTVTVTEGSVIPGDLATPAGESPATATVNAAVDTSALTDVTGSLQINYGSTSFNNDAQTLFANVDLTNAASQPIDGPFVVVIENLTDPLVSVLDFDGRTVDGNPYIIVNAAATSLQPGEVTSTATLSFLNPNATPFEYKLTVLAAPNEAPSIVSQPIVLVEAGRPYAYGVNAIDPNEADVLTYELLTAPSGMTIDSASGEITWSPDTDDIGNNEVSVRVSDGRGGFDEQQFTVEVRDVVPNRPPVIVSSPVTQTTLSGATPQITTPTTIGVWNANRGGLILNYDTGTDIEELRDDLAESFPNGTLVGTSRLDAEFLAGIDVLALHSITSGFTEADPLSAEEQTALFDFVRHGGSVLLLVDNDGATFSAYSDSVLGPFGMDSAGVISGVTRASVTAPDHPIFNGPFGEVTGFDTWFPSQIVDFGPYANSVAALSGNRSVGAVIEPGAIAEGSGGVVVFSDSISGYPEKEGNQAERTTLFKNSLAWLGGSNLTRDVSAVTISEFIELTPADVGSASTTTFSTLPSEDTSLFGADFEGAQSVNFDVDPFGNPIPSGTFITTQYESLGLVMNNFQVSDSAYGGPASAPNTTTTPATSGETLEFQFVVPVVAVGFINTSPDQDELEFLDSDGQVIFSTRDQNSLVSPDFDTDRFVGVVADPSRPISAVRVINADPNGTGRLELDELIFVPAQSTYEYQVEALDPDFDPIRYQLEAAPAGMVVNASTGLISWAPGSDDVRTHTVRVTANDGRGGTATQEYELVVLADPTNTAPVITTTPVDELFIPGFSNPASGDVTPQRISLDLGNGDTFDGTVSITLPESAGRFADIVISVDESASMGGDQDWIPEMIPLLDNALKAEGVGSDPETPNRFAIVGGGRQNLVSYFFSQQANTKYTLYGPDNTVVADGIINEVLPDEILNLQLANDGRYVLVVEAANAADLPAGIDVGVEGEFGEAARVEQLQLNTLIVDEFLLPGQPVEYQFSLSTDTLLYFDSLTKDVYSTLNWNLEGPTGVLATNKDFQNSDTTDSTPTYSAPAGDYRLTLDARFDTASDYRFQLIDLSAGTTITSGELVTGEFETKVETDAYRFTATAGQVFRFNNTISGFHAGSRWRLIDSGGNVLAVQTPGVNVSNVELPADGEYYLLMEAALFPNEGNQQLRIPSTYEFTATFEDAAPPTAIAFGETVNGNVSFVGEISEYSITLNERTYVYLDSLTDSGLTWTLTGPADTISNVRFNGSDSFNNSDPVRDLVAGDYVLRVNGNVAGDFSFRLLNLADAQPVTPGTEFSGELTVPNETDMFRFGAAAGDEFYIDITSASDTSNTLYRIYDQYGRKLLEQRSLADAPAIFEAPIDGEYTLLVEGWRANTDLDLYAFNIVPKTVSNQPLTLGTITNGSLATPGAIAEYTFELTNDTQLYFDSLTNNSALQWSLEGPRGEEITDRRFHVSDANSVSDISIDARAGSWKLTVEGLGDATGDFDFILRDLLDDAQSTPITPAPGAANPSVSISATSGIATNQTEVFRFEANAGDEFSFVTTINSGSTLANYRILDSNGTDVVPFTGLTTDQLNEVLPRTGTYYLIVETRVGRTEPTDWTIDINFVQNNTIDSLGGDTFAFGDTLSGSLAEAFVGDGYVFTVTERGTYYFDSLTDSSNVRWNLDGPTGRVIGNRSFAGTDSFNQSNVGLDLIPGDYRIAVYSNSGARDYEFRLLNLSEATPITLGTAFSNTLEPGNETHAYKFAANAGDELLFDVEAASDVSNNQYKLLDPFGRRFFTSSGLRDFGPTTLTFDGTYMLVVEGWRANVGPDTYTMNVKQVPAATETALTLGTTYTGAHTETGQVSEFVFTLNEYTQVHFDTLNNSAYRWNLSNELDTIINNRGFQNSDSYDVTQTVIELLPGTYRLRVTGQDAANDFEFRLLDVSNGTPITPDTATTSNHPNTRSTEVFRLDAQAGDIYFFDSQGSSGFTTTTPWRLIDPFGDEVAEQNINSDFGPVTLAQTGTYHLLLEGRRTDTGSNGEFTFEAVSLGNELNPIAPTALAFDEVVSSEITKPFEQDRYAFSLTQNSLLYFDALVSDSLVNWSLENDLGRTIISNRRFTQSDSNGITNPVLSLRSGDYVLTIQSNTVRPYEFNLRNLASATEITSGTPFTGEFTDSLESDLYRFTGSAGQQVYVDVLSTLPNANGRIRIVDSVGQVLAVRTTLQDIESTTLPNDGDYFLLVESNVSSTTNTTYEINLVTATTTATELNLGETQSGEIVSPGDTTEYTFSLDSLSNLYFDTFTDSGTITWTLTGPQGTEVAARRLNATDSFDQADPVLSNLLPGDYTLTIDGTLDAVGTFSFRLVDLQDTTPVNIGDTISGDLELPNETDTYQFTASRGDVLLIDIQATDDLLNTLYRVYDPIGREIIEVRNLTDFESSPLPSDGTYTLLVEGWRANTGLDSYQLELATQATRTTAINVGDTVNDSINELAEQVAYTFDVASDTFLYLDALTNNSQITWKLEGPAGEVVSPRAFTSTDSFNRTSPVVEARAGSYTLTIDGILDEVSNYSFRLLDVADATELILPTTAGDAVAVRSGATVPTLDPANVTQAYRFTATAGDEVSFDMISTNIQSAIYRLIDPFGRTQFSRTITSDWDDVLLESDGDYTLLVEGSVAATFVGTYDLQIVYNGNTPPTPITGTALTFGTTYTETLTAGSADAYQFTVTERTLAHMDALTDSSSIRWNLRGPRGVEVTNRSFTGTDSINSPTSTLDLRPGTYQLDVFASDGTARDYSFTLHNFEDATTITPGSAFPVAPDNLLGRQTDLYQFDALAGERYLVDVVSVGSTSAGEFKVIDPLGRVAGTSVSGVRDLDQISITIDGTYTLLVEGARNNATPDAYELNVHRIETTDRALMSNQSNRETMAPGEEYRYSFDVTERSLFLFTPQTSISSLEWSLAGDTGSFVDARRFNQGLFPVDLPAGSYVLTVDGVNDYTGDAFFTAVIADESSQLVSEEIANGQLTADSSVAVFQFNGTAGQHFALRPDFNLVFDDAATSAITAEDLRTGFDNEDGLSGIDVSLRNDVFRDGAALNFIVVTDEDRDILDDQATPEKIFGELSQRDALLNVIVNSRFQDENGNSVIGVDNEGNAYRADGSGGFTTSSGGVSTTNEISVREDYINLAWALQGAAWDLNQLRVGGVTAESFTNAFVDVKVSEILEQTSLRLSASDESADVTYINPSTPVYDTIVGGQTYDFDIQIGNDGNPKSFDLLFTQGQTVGSIPVYIVNPYGYNAQAFDADGDALTWSLTDGPGGLFVDPVTGVLAWPADSVVYGEHPVTLRVSDGRGGIDEQSFVLDVNGGEAASISGTVSDLDATRPTTVELLNGSFEFPTVPVGGFTNFTGSDLPGWTVETSGPSVSVISEEYFETGITFQSQDGQQWLDLEGLATQSRNGISQLIETIPGQEYVVSFYVGSADNSPAVGEPTISASTVDVVIDDGAPVSYTNTITPTDSLDWQQFEHRFTATSTETKLSFFSGSEVGNFLSGLDNVAVTTVLPLPASDATVFLDQNRNGILDPGETATQTDADGNFSFPTLASGSYTVAIASEPGRQLIFPGTSTYEVSLQPGEDLPNLDFVREAVPVVNTDPLIASTPDLQITAGEQFSYVPAVEELDGDDLAFDLPLAPTGMAVNEANGTISWTPQLDQIGPQTVVLRVRDGNGGFDVQFFTIDVQQPNTVPVITSTPPAGPAGVNLPFTYDVNAVDTIDDVLTFELLDAPFGATIDASTGVISWTPSAGQLGTADFDVLVTDEQGATAQQTFNLEVELNPVNADPEILSTAPTEVWLGSTFTYVVKAVDVNGDPLTFALANAPAGMTIDANGTITWEPSPSQTGDNAVSVTVDDGRGGVATQDFTLTVATQPVNLPPQITTPPITTAVAGQAYRFEPEATDANNDTLVWELVEGPEGMIIDPATGVVLWNPTIDDLGSETVVLRVYDSSAAFSELGYTLNVRAVNTPPVIQSAPLTSAAVGATYFYGVAATDADGDRLTYSLTLAPAGMTVDPATGIVSWTPQAGQEGTNAVEVTVVDGNGGTVSQSFDVVTAAGVSNAAPSITSTPGFFASADELYSYDADASDPEGTAISFELLQSPSGMTIDANSGLIEWTPTSGDLGTSIVRLVARDAAGAGSIQEFSLTVLPANNLPVITSTPVTSVTSGDVYRYDVLATDADGEFLTYELTQAPAGMLIDGLGRIFWSPTSSQTGNFDVEVRVRDPRGGLATQTFALNVEVDTVDPQVAVLLSSNPVDVGDSVDVRVSAIDNVGVESLSLTIDGVAVALDANGQARVPMTSVGSFVAEAMATDAAGNTATNSITIFVADPNDTEGPVLAFGSPAEGGIVTALTDVVGTVTDDSLVEYRLLLAEFGSTEFQLLATGNTNISDGVLGQIDPTLLANGTYVLRLQAIDAGGRSNVLEQTIDVTNENKLGNFRLSFTDLAIPVNGVDVVLSRTYDSLNSQTQGDFGFGWNMDFRDVQLQVSVPEASDFDKSFGFYTPYREGTRVYITLPGGEREGFTFTPVAKGLPGLVFFNPRFTADDGVTSTLTVANANLSNNFGEYSGFASGQPYNPAAFEFGGGFTLTTKDGLVYRINADTGQVTRISDPNGNRLDFSDSGVTSNSGISVTFERDTAGRITAAIDPEGQRIEYGYSEAGDLTTVTDRNGNVTTIKYESDRPHYLTEVVDPFGNTGILGEYDDDGRLVSLTDADGNSLDITTNVDNNTQAVVDALGNQTIYEYDARGNTTAVTNALGHTTLSSFDVNNNLLTETDPLGRVTSYTYDAFDNILTITQPDGGVTRYTYANAQRGLVSSITDPLGNVTQYAYDSAGNLISVTDSTGIESSSTYDARGNLTQFDNPVSGQSTSTFTASGRLASSTDALGNTTTFTQDANGRLIERSWVQTLDGTEQTLKETFTYDDAGNVISETDAAGNTTLFEYDAANRMVSTTDALGRVTRFVYNSQDLLVETILPDSTPADLTDNPRTISDYDALGREISFTDELGRTTWTEYDGIGQVTAQILPDSTPGDLTDNPKIVNEYDAAGQLTATIDELGNRTEFEYDLDGNQVLVRDALGNEIVSEFDAFNRQVQTTDPLGQETSYSYDDAGRLVETLFADNTTTRLIYDSSGLLSAQIDQNGNTTTFDYDALGRLNQVTEANGSVTQYEYDEVGNLLKLTDANGNTTTYVYDELSRRVSVERPLGERDVAEFDAVGNRVAYTDFNGDRHTFDFDERDRLVTKNIVGEVPVAITYLANSLPATVTDERGTTSYVYDERDRLTSQTDPDGSVLGYTYDPASNVTSISTLAGVTSYTFDELNRIATVTDIASETTQYTYDDVGRLTQTSFANGITEDRSYDAVNRLTSIESTLAGSVVDRQTWTYDARGNRLSVTEIDGRRVEYSYDSVNRLTSETVFSGPATPAESVTTFTLDAVGNRTILDSSIDGQTTYVYDANDRLISETTAGETTTYGYDLNGNRIQKTANGTTVNYDYSGENRLLSVDTNGDGSAEIVYQYDVSGNRVTRTENGTTVTYQVDTNADLAQALVEYSDSGVITSYTYASTTLVAQHRGTTTAYYQTDSIGSTRRLTDSSGAVLNTYTYDAFGTVVAETGSFENEFLYDGQRRDSTTGLDYLRARNYDSTTGRMTGVDPFDGTVNNPVSLHNYLYAAANPVNASDPTGLFTLVDISVTTSTLGDVQKSFQKNAFTGLKRVGRIADKLLVPGTIMQNVGAALMTSNTRKSLRGYDIYAIGTELRAAGFQAIGVALAGIYVDTVNDIGSVGISWKKDSKLGKIFGPVELKLKLLNAKLTVGKGKNKKTYEAGPQIDNLIQQYVMKSQNLLKSQNLGVYIQKGIGPFESGVAESVKLAQQIEKRINKVIK